jgi:hypothetical protein
MVIKQKRRNTRVKKRIDASVSSIKKAAKTISADKKISEIVATPQFTRAPYNLKSVDDIREIGHDYTKYGTPRDDFVPSEEVIRKIGMLSRKSRKSGGSRGSRKRYEFSEPTAPVETNTNQDEVPIEEQLPYGSRGNPPSDFNIIGRMKSAAEYKKAHRAFAYKHNLKRDSDYPYRFWIDDEHFVDVDVFDRVSVEQAEREIYAFKRNPEVRRASPEYLRHKQYMAEIRRIRGGRGDRFNPDALKPLWGEETDYYDRSGRSRLPPSFTDILSGDYPESADIIGGGFTRGKKKKIPPNVLAKYMTGLRMTKPIAKKKIKPMRKASVKSNRK